MLSHQLPRYSIVNVGVSLSLSAVQRCSRQRINMKTMCVSLSVLHSFPQAVDEMLGNITATLDSLGLLDDTYIFYMVCHHTVWSKWRAKLTWNYI